MKQKKYYVVFKGYEPGVFRSWKSAEAQINGYSGGFLRSYSDLEDANNAYHRFIHGDPDYLKPIAKKDTLSMW